MGLMKLFFKKPVKQRSKVVVIPRKTTDSRYVAPDTTPLWVKKGWRLTSDESYFGFYHTKYGTWEGLIYKREDIYVVLIDRIPIKKIKKHPHWPCFHKVKGSLYRVHLQNNPKDGDISSIILAIEQTLYESYRL